MATGGLFHGIQLWVNLPRAEKMTPPRYQDIGAPKVALVASPDGGALLRIIAGEVGGYAGPGSTHSPMAMVHTTVSPGARVEIPWPTEFNALVYVLGGDGTVGDPGRPVTTGQLAVFGPGDSLVVAADEQNAGARRSRPRRATDRRAGLCLRALRHEYESRGGPGVRGLPGRSSRHRTRRAHRLAGRGPGRGRCRRGGDAGAIGLPRCGVVE